MKYIRETFTRNSEDKLTSLNVGKIKLIRDWMSNYVSEEDFILRDDLTIDLPHGIILDYKNISSLPEFINFNKSYDTFSISGNSLTTLRGCPLAVYGNFYCDNNNLTSLKHAPEDITGNLMASRNSISKKTIFKELKIINFSGLCFTDWGRYSATDKLLMENFSRNNNDKLSSIGIGKIQLIKKWLEDHNFDDYIINPDLKINVHSVAARNEIKGNLPDFIQFGDVEFGFILDGANITSMKGFPENVGRGFSCEQNPGLTSLKYAPKSIARSVWLRFNPLISEKELSDYYNLLGGFQHFGRSTDTTFKDDYASSNIYNSRQI